MGKNDKILPGSKKRMGSIKPGEVRNPTGKGGFRDHPETRANGRWSKENSYSYWLNFFKTLSIPEFQEYKRKHSSDMSMAALAAYARVMKSVEKLEEFREVANRTEGMPRQQIELSADRNKPLVFDVNLRQTPEKNDG